MAIPLASSEDSRAAATSAIATASPIPLNHRPGQDISWRHTAGRTLPISASAGPAQLTTHQARGFAPTTDGAALAAAHLLQHTQPSAGSAVFTPTITEQVVSIPGRPTPGQFLALTRRASPRQQQADDPSAQTVAFRLPPRAHAMSPPIRSITIGVAVADGCTPHGQLNEYTVQLLWRRGDWRMIPPPAGTWTPRRTSTADRALTAYNRLGPTGGAS
ncbi:hypothetical protein LWF15_33365 [Kineosporia rhizophila]|uniref:hypothetical protein n=1 Tax=Kineosporia rhizophila TaxID=84633 RepID=UPI001E2EEE88|nr:hypothetical protein [Kineosporia rhizophila]MCE0540394.1 hypothetical protein [Kineosporia rhizophila]